MLTLCYQVTYKDLIATSSIVKMSNILTFSCMMSYTCISQLFCLTYHIQVSNILKLEVWVSSYRHTKPSRPHILRTIWLQQGDHTFRHHLYFLSSLLPLETMVLCKSVMKDNILCELYADTYSEVWCLWNWNSRQWQWLPHNSSM
jgi:hypothetical protein